MNIILTALREIYGLFVDDGSYAAIILVWLLIVGVGLPHLAPQGWCAPILCAGLLVILLENIMRSARRR
jgi:hypothetical protein